MQNGYLDQVPVDRVKAYQAGLTEYITSSHSQLLAQIAAEKTLSDPLVAGLKAAIDQFKGLWK